MDEEEKLENGSKKRRVDSEGKEGKLGVKGDTKKQSRDTVTHRREVNERKKREQRQMRKYDSEKGVKKVKGKVGIGYYKTKFG